jgi:hypothetical protein
LNRVTLGKTLASIFGTYSSSKSCLKPKLHDSMSLWATSILFNRRLIL